MYNRITSEKVNRISWGAIFAGTVSALAIATMLNLLGMGIGFSSIDPLNEVHPLAGLGTGTLIWWGLSNLIALFIGGYIAGRVSGYPSKQDGSIHGFLGWALYALVSFLLLAGAVNSAVSGVAGAVGSIFGSNDNNNQVTVKLDRAQEQSRSAAGSTMENVQSDIYDFVNKAERLDILPENASEEMREAQANIDQKTERAIDELDLDQAVREFVNELEFNIDDEGNLNVETAEGELIDKEGLREYLVNNTELSEEEIDGMINKWETRIQEGIDKAEEIYSKAKQKAVEIADKTAEIAGKIAWGAFIILLLGAIVAALGGMLGSPSHLIETREEEHRDSNRDSKRL